MGYPLFLTYIALMFLRPHEWFGPILGWRIMAVALVLATIVTVAENFSENSDFFRDTWRSVNTRLMLGFCAAAVASHLLRLDPYFKMVKPAFMDMLLLLLVFLLASTQLTTPRRIWGMLTVIGVGVVFMSIHAWMQWHYGAGFGGQEPQLHEGIVRVQAFGFFKDPNDLALILVASVPFLLLAILGKGHSPFARMIALFALAPILAAIFMTQSRGGWLALAVTVAAFVAVQLGRRWRIAALLVSAVLFAVIVSAAPGRMGAYSTEDASARGRWAAWGDGLQMLKANPVAGTGYQRYMEFASDSRMAHNSFVQCFGELGLLGYFFWLGLVVVSLVEGYALATSPPLSDTEGGLPPLTEAAAEDADGVAHLARAALPGLVGFMAAGFFLSRTYVNPLFIFFGLFTALGVIRRRAGGELPPLMAHSWQRRVRWIVAAEFGSIIGIYFITRLMWAL